MGVVTNKPRFFTEKLLDGRGDRALHDGRGRRRWIRRKPHGDMGGGLRQDGNRASKPRVMIGDSDSDVLARAMPDARCGACRTAYNRGRAPKHSSATAWWRRGGSRAGSSSARRDGTLLHDRPRDTSARRVRAALASIALERSREPRRAQPRQKQVPPTSKAIGRTRLSQLRVHTTCQRTSRRACATGAWGREGRCAVMCAGRCGGSATGGSSRTISSPAESVSTSSRIDPRAGAHHARGAARAGPPWSISASQTGLFMRDLEREAGSR